MESIFISASDPEVHERNVRGAFAHLKNSGFRVQWLEGQEGVRFELRYSPQRGKTAKRILRTHNLELKNEAGQGERAMTRKDERASSAMRQVARSETGSPGEFGLNPGPRRTELRSSLFVSPVVPSANGQEQRGMKQQEKVAVSPRPSPAQAPLDPEEQLYQQFKELVYDSLQGDVAEALEIGRSKAGKLAARMKQELGEKLMFLCPVFPCRMRFEGGNAFAVRGAHVGKAHIRVSRQAQAPEPAETPAPSKEEAAPASSLEGELTAPFQKRIEELDKTLSALDEQRSRVQGRIDELQQELQTLEGESRKFVQEKETLCSIIATVHSTYAR